jgi:hypothetical protein
MTDDTDRTNGVRCPPAPEGQQGPPTRAATRNEALRDTRGSLPLTSGTASRGDKKKVDLRCWYEGYRVGRWGQPRRSPHPVGSLQSWSWSDGWIEGKVCREQDARRLDAGREH